MCGLQKKMNTGRMAVIRMACIVMLLALCISGTALAATLRTGSEGEEVAKLQKRLSDLGYFTQTVSGVYDAETKAAVKLFQKANGISSSAKSLDARAMASCSRVQPEILVRARSWARTLCSCWAAAILATNFSSRPEYLEA